MSSVSITKVLRKRVLGRPIYQMMCCRFAMINSRIGLIRKGVETTAVESWSFILFLISPLGI